MASGRNRVAVRTVGLCMTACAALGSVREASTVVEYRFAGGPPGRWRMERSAAERHAPSWESWRRAQFHRGTRHALVGDRVMLGVRSGAAFPEAAARELGLRRDRTVGEGLWILQAGDVWAAARAAEVLARRPEVDVAAPVMRRGLRMHGPFGARPNDPYFPEQWHLENRDAQGMPVGPDTNPRGAWAVTRGEGVTIAVCDDGFEVEHPDLQGAAAGQPHYDFTADVAGARIYGSHATAVAGVAAATGGNQRGVAGVAPAAGLVSLAIFDRFGEIASDERMMDMFQYRIEAVQVQNHSWGNGDVGLNAPTAIELEALARAVNQGRDGLGVVIVRSSGNGRELSTNLNDDGYGNDPRVIAVGAVRKDGRAASYSNPGACLLLAAPSGDDSDSFAPTINLVTTDRVGSRGYNQQFFTDDRADYGFGETGFSGTSASAPQVAGLAALVLAANPALTSRDVQQVLLHAARHADEDDPDARWNGAGYRVGHNQGFGVPDAGQAVELASRWSPRPPVVVERVRASDTLELPDDGLRAWITEDGGVERSLRGRSALGPHPDDPTARLPLVSVGKALEPLTADLRGRAALIERGENFFRDKIRYAADAGAAFAVIFNHIDRDQILIPAGTDFVPIPALLVSENDGRALLARLEAGARVEAQLRVDSRQHRFQVARTLVCEHVGLRVRARHDVRGDLRITLVSPSGTRSVLQHFNQDTEPAADDWTFWSVQHFYEPSAGEWVASYADQEAEVTGVILESELIVRGVEIEDTDADGLDDGWERRWFGDLGRRAGEDSDADGGSNAREQVLGTDPTRVEGPLRLEVAPYDAVSLRLSWPTVPGKDYQVLRGDVATQQTTVTTRVPGRFPEAEWIVPLDRGPGRFFRVQEVSRTDQ